MEPRDNNRSTAYLCPNEANFSGMNRINTMIVSHVYIGTTSKIFACFESDPSAVSSYSCVLPKHAPSSAT